MPQSWCVAALYLGHKIGAMSRETKDKQRRERMKVLDLSAVGIAFPVAILFGYFVGRLIGGWFDAARVGGMIGLLFGIAGGFYNFIKMAIRLSPPSTAASEDDSVADDE